ncbi:hypothetical protein PYCC9005_001019 [Savitreella phatthalungensis]
MESSSVFANDPADLATAQRLVTSMENVPLSSPGEAYEISSGDDLDSDVETDERPAHRQSKSRPQQQPNFNDESAFPSLNGGSNPGKGPGGAAKSLWGSGGTSRPVVAPVRSQVVSASDLVTETVKLDSADQQARTLGVGETVKTLQRRTGTTIQMSTAQKTGTTTFLIRGKPDAVAEAKAALFKDLAKRVILKISVPSVVRPFIIGSKGKTLKMIQDKTGARIQLPKRDESIDPAEHDSEEMSEITIEADVYGATEARKQIEAIVAERTSSASIKITDVPADHFPFVALEARRWEAAHDTLKVKVPLSLADETSRPEISVSGSKEVVDEIKSRIEGLSEQLARNTIVSFINLPKPHHQFVSGTVQNILEQTGCSVVIPPTSSSSDQITVRGPAANLGNAISLVMEKANSMALDSLEISRAHGGSIAHAANLTRFLSSGNCIAPIEKQHNVKIALPKSEELASAERIVYYISGPQSDSVRLARTALIGLVNSLPPAKFDTISIEPLLHNIVVGPKQKNLVALKKELGIDVVVPTLADDENFVLVAEKAADPASARQSLADAKAQLQVRVDAAGHISSQTISIPSTDHKFITGKNKTTLNAITGGSDSTVRVIFGEPNADDITVRGPEKEVIRVIKEFGEVIVQAKDAQAESDFKLEFAFPPQFAKNLIGKGGQNITKLRDELGVKIEVDDEGNVTVQGPPRNAEEAKARITALEERLLDETTYRLKIPAEFHGQIIGQGGKLVKRLEEKYEVSIQFPRSNTGVKSSSTTDDRDKVGKNEVVVKGGKRGATKARDEIMELFAYESEHAYSTTIRVLQKSISHIVGRAGTVINELKEETNTRIDIDRSADSQQNGTGPDSSVTITITGKKSQVEIAKARIEEIDRELEDTVQRSVIVDPAHHRTLIGTGGNNLRDIVVKAGGPEDASARAHMVRFPRQGEISNEIVLRGPRKVVEKIAKAFEKLVGDASNQHSEVIDVPAEQVRMVIGRAGTKKQELETVHSVTIDVPRASSEGTGATLPVKILGKPENVELAKAAIVALIKTAETDVVSVPRRLHAVVADGGSFIRKLKSDCKVSVSHDGQKTPSVSRPKATTTPSTAARIDDDSNDEVPTAFMVVEAASSEELGDIPWVLKGDRNNLERAKRAIAKAISQAEQQTHIAYMTVPSEKHRFIIGPGGSTITEIRQQSGTKIDVPREKTDETIVLKGSKQGLEQARDLILEAIKPRRS